MKIQNLVFSALVVSCIFFACKKDDSAPTITMLGNNPDTMLVKTASKYADPGATAVDDKDGDITSKIVVASNVDVNKPGHYIVYYNVEDNAHNLAPKLTRIVEVVKADGNYSINATCSMGSLIDSIHVVSNSTYDTLSLNGFYNAATTIKAVIYNGVYKIYNQPVVPGLDSVDGEITVSGTKLTLQFTYRPDLGSPISCSSPMVKY